jgi:hypothetical protein
MWSVVVRLRLKVVLSIVVWLWSPNVFSGCVVLIISCVVVVSSCVVVVTRRGQQLCGCNQKLCGCGP